ncbi:MAG: decarboxylating 6-phosphogluconate dehydrogenase [Patescibacteria group bacterium]|nr:decarboxylating 6-phosphogluconate dehydrogenase [Patescibacteria group bacterium]
MRRPSSRAASASKKASKKPPIGVFGLGKMGGQIARRLHASGFPVVAWNRSPGPVEEAAAAGLSAHADLAAAVQAVSAAAEASAAPRVFWVMLPQGVVDDFISGSSHIGSFLRPGDIVIDGGNSFYKDSMRRAAALAERGVRFFDCGTSGGVWGEREGFALMAGGPREAWPDVEPFMRALSSGDNYGLVGPAGAGHFTKMVHNGIEYGMMEAIGEGYAVLRASPFGLDLSAVTRIYQKGSVIRSWLIDLCKDIFDSEDVEGASAVIDATGEGSWTVEAGKELGVDVRVIEDSVKVRAESKDPKNAGKYSNRIVALLRKHFGGHAVHPKRD